MATPVLIYDGDCAFCTRSVQWIERHLPTSAEPVPFQFADLAGLGVTWERAEYEALWVRLDGRIDGGAQAFASLLIEHGGLWRALGALLRVPPFRWLAHGAYRLIANNRHRLPGGTPACLLPADQRPGAQRRAS